MFSKKRRRETMSIEIKKCPYCGGDYEYNDD